MKIKRAVKCAAIKDQLKKTLKIAKKADIRGLEIQEILPLMENYSFEKRGEAVIEIFKNYSLTSLVYHFPLKDSWNDVLERKRFDLSSREGSHILNLTKETIKEAVFIGKALDIKTEIPIVVHLFGFAKTKQITEEERRKRFRLGEKRLIALKEMADNYSEKSGLKLIIVRENLSPSGQFSSIIDFHPRDIIRTSNLGIGTNLDFSHIWLTSLYYQSGKGEYPGVDLTKKIYPTIILEEAIDLLKPSLKLIHINDAGPDYRMKFEGLEIGKGNFPHSQIIPLICEKIEKDIIGTYEMKKGHEDPESILRSDQFYRKLFKEKFKDYFE